MRANISHLLACEKISFDKRGIEALPRYGIAADCDDITGSKATRAWERGHGRRPNEHRTREARRPLVQRSVKLRILVIVGCPDGSANYFTLSNSTSKISVSSGPMIPPAPRGP